MDGGVIALGCYVIALEKLVNFMTC